MADLVQVEKPGQPTLLIHPSALQEHLRLGWVQVERVIEQVEQKFDDAVEKLTRRRKGASE